MENTTLDCTRLKVTNGAKYCSGHTRDLQSSLSSAGMPPCMIDSAVSWTNSLFAEKRGDYREWLHWIGTRLKVTNGTEI